MFSFITLHPPGHYLSYISVIHELSEPPESCGEMVLNLYRVWDTVVFGFTYVSLQMTLTADELISPKVCVTYDIETILGRFGPLEVPHAGK